MDKSFYENRKSEGEKVYKEIANKCNLVSFLRLATFMVFIAVCFFIYYMGKNYLIYGVVIISVVLFIYFVYLHSKKLEEKIRREKYIEINEEAIQRIDGGWKKFQDTGSEFLDIKHPFVNDLDIFGEHSLFQWVNTTKTSYGRKKLASLLSLNELPSKEEIYERQQAVKELGKNIDFRQKLQVEGSLKDSALGDTENFIQWCKGKNENILGSFMKIAMILLPVVFLSVTFLYFFTDYIISIFPVSIGILNFLVLKLGTKERNEALDIVYELKSSIYTYFNMIKIVEDESFDSNKLTKIKSMLINDQYNFIHEMKELNSIANKIADRKNMIYIIVNVALLWDYHLLTRLEYWRRKNSSRLEQWLEALGEIETLCSIANISGDNPNWTYGEITEDLSLEGENVSHPLIGERAIANSFSLNNNNRIMLVTGSNMSGKSTFLRTIGINTIFTYIGAPVNGTAYKCPILNIYTCMRIGDNLEENISSFYAEILRIKSLINATDNGERVLFMLDEIFRGTNSKDRHTGAEILINQLSEKTAIGLVSTHDLELCDLEENNKKVINYNFREHYENNEIKFDYKLRKGKSTTRNAIYLMKMAGINI
ncbi:DNA mismatch repair protein MutS [Clostridium sp. YIM B02505]|uniref:DNA mismatch repair protein MutS n=1 Tax=Clostridium yunnanense TaxID=2800325 RepID=A0ABS1EPZ0_9CLOT|nr:MutS family DNA mismatch repair protein [Clostridium yunnanense]MBK1811383.1 DNA mismatch repair protein MutS [Clostridium yunnanense]